MEDPMQKIDPQEIEIIIQDIKQAVNDADWVTASELLNLLRPQDQADVFEEITPEDQSKLIPSMDIENAADLIEELGDEAAARLANELNVDQLAEILDYMEPDEAADLLGDMSDEAADQALSEMEESDEVRLLLEYGDESAGGLMTSAEVLLQENMTVQDAIDHLRQTTPDSETIYYLFVTNKSQKLTGIVSLRQLVIESPSKRIGDIMTRDVISVNVHTDQEEAARLLARYDLLALPVVDDENHFLGVITHDDVLEIVEEEATEDIYRLGGVPQAQPSDQRAWFAIRSRLPWLVLNLITAMASATVLALFEGTIAQVAVLAAFFPIVAGVSGSAGTQTLTVIVRGLALGELKTKSNIKILLREMSVGLMNGIVIGIMVAIIALVWKEQAMLGLVVGTASFLTLICAAIAGFLVPVGIQKMNIDPALGSPILVTTITDSLGYLIYLGLASILIAQLI
ncbi:MAG: magnesium transporter [Anaerolineaceae bacterium]|nr:magnesium transporter [Anaerolineaceae bacterium]